MSLIAGDAMHSPFTLTRPCEINRSASRREQIPARAMTFAIRSPGRVGSVVFLGIEGY
jgi:hypothetical protein